jgi:hypothetical protein
MKCHSTTAREAHYCHLPSTAWRLLLLLLLLLLLTPSWLPCAAEMATAVRCLTLAFLEANEARLRPQNCACWQGAEGSITHFAARLLREPLGRGYVARYFPVSVYKSKQFSGSWCCHGTNKRCMADLAGFVVRQCSRDHLLHVADRHHAAVNNM